MKKISVSLIILVVGILFVAGCSNDGAKSDNNNVDVKVGDDVSVKVGDDVDVKAGKEVEVKVDTTDNGNNDVMIKTDGVNTETTVDFDEVMTDESKDAIKNVDPNNYCVKGSKYVYESADGNVDSIVIGLESFKGKTWCKANSKSTISSPAGEVVTDSMYYFDSTYKEYWVITTVSSAFMPEAQVTETHIIDGKVA